MPLNTEYSIFFLRLDKSKNATQKLLPFASMQYVNIFFLYGKIYILIKNKIKLDIIFMNIQNSYFLTGKKLIYDNYKYCLRIFIFLQNLAKNFRLIFK